MKKYTPKDIEKKWQKYWEAQGIFKTKETSDKPKYYVLDMFPYPSGSGLHVGHPKGYIATDVIARQKMMQGYNVLHPMGWDAFGLPAENYAIANKVHPAEAVEKNIATFKKQLGLLGFTYDWDREVNTTDPAYYKWTQWTFLQMFKHGLAYESFEPINWCPGCQTGLANEDLENGHCERCGSVVEKKPMRQWVLKITKYADRLLKDLEKLTAWPNHIKVMQKEWIGRSEGAEIDFPLRFVPSQAGDKHKVRVFTTRPDTIFGATFVAVSAELAKSWIDVGWRASDEVKKYVETTLAEQKVLDREEKEKTGVDAGIKAVNPVNGEEIPVWITNYVMGGVGTGAIMAVPAHDERDFEFTKKYDLPIKEVVLKQCGKRLEGAIRRDGVLGVIVNKEDKVLVLKHKKSGIYRLAGGGFEHNETEEEVLKREITEETGFNDFTIEKPLGRIEANYDASIDKGELRHRISHGYLVRLNSERRGNVSKEDVGVFEESWEKIDDAVKLFEKNKILGEEQFIIRAADEKHMCYTGEGINIDSGFLDTLPTKEAKEKMIAWLEEHGVGKRQVNYKLRDWVFSRQRYWGEPIPLVFCENCAENSKKQETRNKKAILIHGLGGSAEENWFPWFKNEVSNLGYEVFIPNLPNTDKPVLSEWIAELNKIPLKEDDDITIVAHSLGGPVACSFIEQKKLKIRKLILVAPTGNSQSEANWEYLRSVGVSDAGIKAVQDFNQTKKNWSLIESLVEEKKIYLSDNDACIPLAVQTNYLELKPQVKIFHNKGHFNRRVGMYQFEAMLSEFNAGEEINPGWIPLPEDQLPLELPKVSHYEPTGTGESPLANITEWVNTTCPRCGHPARRETNTMPQWAGSCWYYLRYIDPHNDKALVDTEKEKYWSPVDHYVGGAEHATRHLIYARFWHKFLYDIGAVNYEEPFTRLQSVGLILAEDGRKMSKRWGNVITPDDIVEKYGADSMRLYEMFMGPFDQPVAWDTNGLVGVRRFLDRVWNLQEKVADNATVETRLIASLHQTIRKVTEDIEAMRFNTAIAKMMELVNEMMKEEHISHDTYQTLIKLLSPFAPHIAEELWSMYGQNVETQNFASLPYAPWPKFDPELAKESVITIAIQVNGKIRDTIEVAAETGEEEVKRLALASEKVQKWFEGKEPKKVIYVKGKLVSIVI